MVELLLILKPMFVASLSHNIMTDCIALIQEMLVLSITDLKNFARRGSSLGYVIFRKRILLDLLWIILHLVILIL